MTTVTVNRKAFHDYFIVETYDAGIMLTGNEVKAIREGRVNLKDSFVRVKGNEVLLVNAHISEYSRSSRVDGYEPTRPRKLLLNKLEIDHVRGHALDKGLTVVPLEIFFSTRGFAKVKIAVVKGKQLFDKRETIKKRDIDRDMRRELKK